jgi:hypothetical protein
MKLKSNKKKLKKEGKTEKNERIIMYFNNEIMQSKLWKLDLP